MKNNDYIEQYKILHGKDAQYGASSLKFIEEIAVVIDHLCPRKVLDFGCGKGALLNGLIERYPGIVFYGYDPAVPGRDKLPGEKFDLVINTDVLEHIPEHILPSVLEEIASLSGNVYFNLHHALAKTILPNGENAHCTVKPSDWYHALMRNYFDYITPLKGRRDYLSVVLTFAAPEQVIKDYLRVLTVVSRRPVWKRVLRILTLREWRHCK